MRSAGECGQLASAVGIDSTARSVHAACRRTAGGAATLVYHGAMKRTRGSGKATATGTVARGRKTAGKRTADGGKAADTPGANRKGAGLKVATKKIATKKVVGKKAGRSAGERKAAPWLPDPMPNGAPPVRTGKGRRRVPDAVTDSTPPAAGRRRQRPLPTIDDPHAEREAQRYAQPIASREALLALLAEAAGPQTAEELAVRLGYLAHPERFEALCKRLAAMLRDGQVLANRRGGYALATKLDLIPGTVIANPEGFGFLRTDAGGDDLFLPPHELRKAMHGDRVLASVTGIDRRGRREGAIVEVLERRRTRILGRYAQRGSIGYVVPDDRRLLQDVLIAAEDRAGAREGQLVVCEIVEPPAVDRLPLGRILTVLGDRLTPSLVVEAALHGHGLPTEFPPEVLAEALAIPVEVDAALLPGRVDLRHLPLVTIDGEDAKDFDDALYCEAGREGFRLIVAIADVSHYVRPGTHLDGEASDRATSVYFPGFVVPMLPETLSNGICSLKPKVDRCCFVCDMQIGRDGDVLRATFYEAIMRSHARLTYTEVWAALGEDDAEAQGRIGALLPHLRRLHRLYKVLAKARVRRGAIEFESAETRFVLGPAGEVVQAGMLERNDAHKLVEECMIAANVEAARLLISRGLPTPFRIHERPPEGKYTELLEFLADFGLSLPPWSKVEPRDFTALIRKIRDRPESALIESVLLRSQSLAVYSPDNRGHFGLALAAYAHFTSPIRRYPDLLVHRAIKHALAGGSVAGFRYAGHEMASLSLHCSERGRRADEASREVDERYRAAWMEKHVGGEFDGVISGVTSFGLFVELSQSKVNGLVHVTQLPRDYYHFDPSKKLLTGEHGGRTFRLGDAVRIVVLRASVEDRRIDFRLVSEPTPGRRSGQRR